MTTANTLPESCYASLVHCLYTVSEQCPDTPPAADALHRLRNLVLVLLSQLTAAPSVTTSGMTLTEALTLVTTSRELLTVLTGQGTGGPVNSEMNQALSETLDALTAGMGAALRQAQADKVRGLYVIIDPQVTGGRDPMEIASAAVNGGAKMLQLRDKLRDKGEILTLATPLQQLCQEHGVMLIMNDHVDLGATVGSAGVHVGQTDMPVDQVRKVLAPHQVLGRSNREFDQLIESQEMGVDHVAFGAIYRTTTKGVGRPPQGIEPLRKARELAKVPLVAIGGINIDNVTPVVEAGADAICVTAAVASAENPEAAAAAMVEAIRSAGGKV